MGGRRVDLVASSICTIAAHFPACDPFENEHSAGLGPFVNLVGDHQFSSPYTLKRQKEALQNGAVEIQGRREGEVDSYRFGQR